MLQLRAQDPLTASDSVKSFRAAESSPKLLARTFLSADTPKCVRRMIAAWGASAQARCDSYPTG